jgi:DNA polymerase II large subunit
VITVPQIVSPVVISDGDDKAEAQDEGTFGEVHRCNHLSKHRVSSSRSTRRESRRQPCRNAFSSHARRKHYCGVALSTVIFSVNKDWKEALLTLDGIDAITDSEAVKPDY